MKLTDLMEIATLYDQNLDFLWDSIRLDSRLDKSVLVQTVIDELGNCEPLTNTVATFKTMTNVFFARWEHEITKLVDTLYFDYNPIWNKDGEIIEVHDLDRGEQVDHTRDLNGTDKDTGNEDVSHTNEHKVSPYNAGDYQAHDSDSGSDNTNRNLTSTHDENIDENTNTDEKLSETTHREEHGNIGVTTTQQMITEERALMEFNIYHWIVDKYGAECFLKLW